MPHFGNSSARLAMGGAMILAAGLVTTPASAATTGTTLAVSATVTENCTATTTALDFGNVDVTSGDAATGTGGLSVTCTNGTTWSATADAGAGSGATFAAREMSDGTNALTYSLYTEDTHTTVWGDGVDTSETIDGTGTGAADPHTIYASIPADQAVPAGDYSDTVNITVTYGAD